MPLVDLPRDVQLDNAPSRGGQLFDLPPNAQLDPNTLADPNTGKIITHVPGGTSTPVTDYLYGLRQPIDNLAILGGRAIEGAGPALGFGTPEWATTLRANAQRATDTARQSYTEIHGGPPDDSAFRKAGEMTIPTALGYAMPGSTSASFLPRTASNAFTGAATALMGGDPNAPASDLLGQAALGGTIGAGSSALTGGAARVAEPRMSMPSGDVRNLMDVGVRPTIGQASGGALNRIEQGLGNTIPFAGDMIKASRRRAVLDLNTGVINDVLSPINERLPQGTEVGRPALNYMADRISGAYNRAVPAAGAQLDDTAIAALDALKAETRSLPATRREQFDTFLQDYIHSKVVDGHLSGEGFKAAESNLGKRAGRYLYNRNSDTDALDLGEALRSAQTILRENLARTSPENASEIAAANLAYSRMMPVSRSVARPGVDPGVFSPSEFQGAVYANALSRDAKMRGTAPYMELADAARRTLGPTIPDSGTPYGMIVRDIGIPGVLGGGTAVGHLSPEMLVPAIAGTGALGAVYNPYGQSLVSHLIASRYPWMRATAQPIRAATPAVTAGAATGLLGP